MTMGWRTTFNRLGHALFGLGALLFFFPMIVDRAGWTLTATALPLPDAQAVVRAPDGSFYVGETMYGRVQHYDQHGAFLRGWPMPEGRGKFFALAMRGDTLSAFLVTRKVVLFDSSGDQLREYDSAGYPHQGLVIEAGPPGLYLEGAGVVEKDSAGATHLLATFASPLWFISPLLGWVFAAIGVAIRLLARQIGPG